MEWSFPEISAVGFRVKSLDGVGDDWPLTYWDLEPYYERNDAFIGISGLAGDPANPTRSPRSTPPLGLGPGGDIYVRSLEKPGVALVAFRFRTRV